MNITFTSKATYLQWRSDWKARYKLVSQNIRDLKMREREYCRAWAATNKEIHSWTNPTPDFHTVLFAKLHNVPGYDAAFKRVQRLGIESQRDEARTLLFVLEQAKVEAQVQYLAAHAQVVPA